jgi:hypothetical protein
MADDTPQLPPPVSVADIYLAAILAELQGLRSDVQKVTGPPEGTQEVLDAVSRIKDGARRKK